MTTMTNIDTRQMLPIGTRLKGGEYEVMRYIASGGFGNTYEVVHTRLGKRLAMKEFFMRGINLRDGSSVSVSVDENRLTFDQMRDKFYKEAQRLAKLEEMHIVEVNDFFEENHTAYYTMKLIEGQSLSAKMKQAGAPLSEKQVNAIVPQIVSALHCVHHNGLYHLDLKPANIMQSVDGHCWLIDFGASKQLSVKEGLSLSTSTGLCYTPGFAPSEQISGNVKRIGPWTDFYALGATIYNLLTKQTPPSPDDIMNEGVNAFGFTDQISPANRQLITWLMQPRPADRPQNVEQIMERIGMEVPAYVSTQDTERTTAPMPPSDETVISEPPITNGQVKEEPVEEEEPEDLMPVENKRKTWLWMLIVAVVAAAVVAFVMLSNSDKGAKAVVYDEEEDGTVEVVDSVAAQVEGMYFNSKFGPCSYTGDVDEDRLPHGYGTAKFERGDTYEGSFEHGVLAGDNCVYTFDNGDVFEGSFIDNHFNEGTLKSKSGGWSFKGKFNKNNQPIESSGDWYDSNGNKM